MKYKGQITLSDLMKYGIWSAIEDYYEDSMIEDLFDAYGCGKKDVLNINGYEIKCVLTKDDIVFTFLSTISFDEQVKIIYDIVNTFTETTASMLGHERDIKNMLKKEAELEERGVSSTVTFKQATKGE